MGGRLLRDWLQRVTLGATAARAGGRADDLRSKMAPLEAEML